MRILLYIVLILVVFPTIFFVITGFYSFSYLPDKLYEKALEEEAYDAIIVPGVPFENGNWSDIMEARVRWSHHLYQMGMTKNIIYSGSAVYSPYIESEIMKLYGIALGMPGENLFTESEAEHSTENLAYSYRMATSLGFNRIALATDPFQSLMLELYKGIQPPLDKIPIDFSVLKDLPKKKVSINPQTAFVEGFVSIKEREGFFERFKGTLGKKVKD